MDWVEKCVVFDLSRYVLLLVGLVSPTEKKKQIVPVHLDLPGGFRLFVVAVTSHETAGKNGGHSNQAFLLLAPAARSTPSHLTGVRFRSDYRATSQLPAPATAATGWTEFWRRFVIGRLCVTTPKISSPPPDNLSTGFIIMAGVLSELDSIGL